MSLTLINGDNKDSDLLTLYVAVAKHPVTGEDSIVGVGDSPDAPPMPLFSVKEELINKEVIQKVADASGQEIKLYKFTGRRVMDTFSPAGKAVNGHVNVCELLTRKQMNLLWECKNINEIEERLVKPNHAEFEYIIGESIEPRSLAYMLGHTRTLVDSPDELCARDEE